MTVKVPAVPTVNVVLFADAIDAGWFTVSVKLCSTVPPLLLASNVSGYTLPVPAAGVPTSEPAVKLTPPGSAPLFRITVGVGRPHAVTGNDPAVPVVNVVALALTKTGGLATGSFTLAVFGCPHASDTTPAGTWIDTVPLLVIPETTTS